MRGTAAFFQSSQTAAIFIRHAELVSAPIVPQEPKPRGEEWALKRVQGDV